MKPQRQDILGKTIALLLAMQLFLIGLQAKTRIDQGNSTLETVTWLIQQYIPVLVKVKSLEEKKPRKDESKPKVKRSGLTQLSQAMARLHRAERQAAMR